MFFNLNNATCLNATNLTLTVTVFSFQLFVDKDTIINAVTSSHDVHLLKIDNKEDDMVTRINNWMKTSIEKIHYEQEVKRNRERVAEINNLIDHLRDEIDNLEVLQGAGY
jgi:hypothetical protein